MGKTQRTKRRVLVVDDDENLRRLMEYNLGKWGYDVVTAETGGDMDAHLARDPYDLILLDVQLPDGDGIDFLPAVKQTYPHCEVIMVTAHGDVGMAMDAVRLGAFDFQTKPIDLDRLQVAVRNAVQLARTHEEAEVLKEATGHRDTFGGFVGASLSMQAVYEVIRNVAESDCSVLVTGETGCGKELVATEIHRRSKRRMKKLVTVNCAAIPKQLLESEMFGHEKGAFTGATQRKIGCAERADGSTLFLDEIGEMPMDLQAKLLRFLQDKRFTRVGGTEEIEADIRIVAATNRDPAEAVREGLLREDLLYRINVVKVALPPLRERRDDVRLLAREFLRGASAECGKSFDGFDDDAMAILSDYAWPGNVRQLKNVIQETVVLNRGDVVTADMLPEDVRTSVEQGDRRKQSAGIAFSASRVLPMWQVEREHLQRALLVFNGNVAETAERLEISRATLYRKIKEYDLQQQTEKSA